MLNWNQGFYLLKRLFKKSGSEKEHLNPDDFGKQLAHLVFSWSKRQESDEFLDNQHLCYDEVSKRIFNEETLYLNGWLMEFCINTAFFRQPQIRDRIATSYLWALVSGQKRILSNGTNAPNDISDRWQTRKAKYDENLCFGLDKIPLWLWEFLRVRLGVPASEGIDWMTKHAIAYDLQKMQFLVKIKETLAFLNSIKSEYDLN